MFFRMVYKSGQIFLPFCHNSRVWQTDGQTDRIFIARPRLHSMQRGKNDWRLTVDVHKYNGVSDITLQIAVCCRKRARSVLCLV